MGRDGHGHGTLVTGGSGLLGLNWALARRNTERIVLGTHARSVTVPGTESRPLPLYEVDRLRECLRSIGPSKVVHAAGLADVERCEADPARALAANAEMAERVAVACQSENVRVVHISTDHLFRGTKAMVNEETVPDPMNVYGRTKAEAEVRVLSACPGTLIIRTNFFGWGPAWRRSFSDFIVDAGRRQQPVNVWVDVHHTPISVPAIASAVESLVAAGVRGVVNVVGDERISKFDLAVLIVRQFGIDVSFLCPARAAEAKGRVPRPLDMSLSNERLRSILGRGVGSAADMVRDLGTATPPEIGALG
jgi:dTDP-4-dehydrorhamnose reductase